MFTGLLHTHSLLRWVLLFLIIASIVVSYRDHKKGLAFSAKHKKLALFTMITAHLQLILGFGLYFSSDTVKNALANMGEAMGQTLPRFFAVEHIFGMLVAIVLITVGYSKSKRAEDPNKLRIIFRYFLFALMLILATIPWPFREVFAGRGWL